MSPDRAVQPRPDPAAHQTITDAGRRRAILVAVCIALMAVIASVTGLNVAQPDLAVAFGASQHTILWIINAYTLTLAALLLPLGAVGDRWGRKRVLLVGLVLFGVANVAGAAAPTAEVMLAARVLSGVGAAMIMPITLAVITTTFPPRERSRAIGIWMAVAGGGGLLGMFLSAVLVNLATWRLLFVLPVVLVVAGVMTARSVPDSREIPAHGFDSVGAVTSGLAVLGLTSALHEGPTRGWTDPLTLVVLVVGGGAAVAFVLWERRRPGPLLDVRLFGRRNLSGGSIVLLAVFGVQAGVSVVLYPFFQTVFDWSGLQATLGLLPMAGLMMTSSGIAPRLAERIGDRATWPPGPPSSGWGWSCWPSWSPWTAATSLSYRAWPPWGSAWGVHDAGDHCDHGVDRCAPRGLDQAGKVSPEYAIPTAPHLCKSCNALECHGARNTRDLRHGLALTGYLDHPPTLMLGLHMQYRDVRTHWKARCGGTLRAAARTMSPRPRPTSTPQSNLFAF